MPRSSPARISAATTAPRWPPSRIIDGSGVLSGAHRDIYTIDNGYAVTRNVVLLATLGYEDIRYSGTTPVRINDAIWDFGVRVTPNTDSA